MLTCESSADGGTCDVYLVGTCHVCSVVFLELCSARKAALTRKHVQLASELKVVPGAEFSAAYEQAKKYGGKVMLDDFAKKLEGINFDDKQSLLKQINNLDLLTGIEDLTKIFPTLMEPLVHERDQYMSAKILEVARQHNSVVAVVGRGHLAGIQKNWKQPVELKQLLTVPD